MVMKSELTTLHYVVQLSSLLIFYPHLQDKALFIFTFDFKYNKAQFIQMIHIVYYNNMIILHII